MSTPERTPAHGAPEHPLKATTLKSYAKNAAVYSQYCAQMGLPFLPTTVPALTQFIGAAGLGGTRRPGKSRLQTGAPDPLAPATLDVILSAVHHWHVRAGLPSPVDDPAVAAERRGYRVVHGARPVRATPMTVDDLEALCWPRPSVTRGGLSQAAVALLMLDHRAGYTELAQVRAGHLSLDAGPDVNLRVGDRTLTVPCICAAATPTDRGNHGDVAACLACLLTGLEESVVSAADLLFGEFGVTSRDQKANARADQPDSLRLAGRIRNRMIGLTERWRCIRWERGRLVWVDDVPGEETTVTRRGLVLASTGQLGVLQLRVLLLTAFTKGLRADDVTQRLDTAHLHREAWGYRLFLPLSKADDRGWRTRLVPASSCARCAVCCLDEWLAVRAVATGGDTHGPVVCGVREGLGLVPSRALGYSEVWTSLTSAQRDAGLPGGYSPHSLRRGFARLARQQGASEEQVQRALRHKRLDTTAGYLEAAEAPIPEGLAVLAGFAPAQSGSGKQDQTVARRHSHADHGPACGGRQ